MTTEAEKPEEKTQPAIVAEAVPVVEPPQVETGPSEAESLWDEMIAADEPKSTAASVTGEQVSNEFDDVSTDSKEGDKNQPSAGAGTQTGDGATAAKVETPPTPDEILAKASPEIRAAVDAKIEASLSEVRKSARDAKSEAGRVRKLFEELQKDSASRGAHSKGSTKKVAEILDERLGDLPEVRDPVKDALAPIESKLERLDKAEEVRTAALKTEVIQHIKSQQELLDAAHPGWDKEYVKGPKAKVFSDWIQDQPKRLRDIVFVTNNEQIFDAQGAIEVFDAFNKAIAAAENPTPAPSGQTQELSAKRAAQLDGTTSPRSPAGAPMISGIPREGDERAIWDAFPDDNADDRLTRRRA